jgi:hypothetical protein
MALLLLWRHCACAAVTRGTSAPAKMIRFISSPPFGFVTRTHDHGEKRRTKWNRRDPQLYRTATHCRAAGGGAHSEGDPERKPETTSRGAISVSLEGRRHNRRPSAFSLSARTLPRDPGFVLAIHASNAPLIKMWMNRRRSARGACSSCVSVFGTHSAATDLPTQRPHAIFEAGLKSV